MRARWRERKEGIGRNKEAKQRNYLLLCMYMYNGWEVGIQISQQSYSTKTLLYNLVYILYYKFLYRKDNTRIIYKDIDLYS